MSQLLKIAGLWKNTTKNGDTYLNGKIGDTKILIFANTKQDNEKSPQYTLNIDLETYKSLDAEIEKQKQWIQNKQQDNQNSYNKQQNNAGSNNQSNSNGNYYSQAGSNAKPAGVSNAAATPNNRGERVQAFGSDELPF